MEKLAAGPAFTAHRATSSGKVKDKITSIKNAVETANVRMETALAEFKAEVGQANFEDDDVKSYLKSAEDAKRVVSARLVEANLPENCDLELKQMPEPLRAVQADLEVALDGAAPLVKDKWKLQCLAAFHFAQRGLLTCESIHTIEAVNSGLKEDYAVVDQFTRGLNKVAADIGSYAKQKKRKATQAVRNKKKEQEKRVLEDQKAVAKKHAEEIKLGAKTTHPIFSTPAEKMKSILIRAEGADFDYDQHIDHPWLLKKSGSVTTWRNSASVAMKLAEFAGGYKRTPTFKQDGRSQGIMAPKQGKEETQALIDAIFNPKTLDLSAVPTAAESMSAIWYWGYDPKLCGAALPPNGAAMLRILVMGEVFIMAFEVAKVMTVMKEASLPVTTDTLRSFLLGLQPDSKHWGELGGQVGTMQQDDVLYVLQGWVLCERCSASLIVYGVRKSFFLPGDASKQAFKSAVDSLRASGRDPSKMEAVLKCYDPPEPPAPPASEPVPEAAQAPQS